MICCSTFLYTSFSFESQGSLRQTKAVSPTINYGGCDTLREGVLSYLQIKERGRSDQARTEACRRRRRPEWVGKKKKERNCPNQPPAEPDRSAKRICKPIYLSTLSFFQFFPIFFFFFQSVRNKPQLDRPSTSSFYSPGSTSRQGFPEVIHDCCTDLDNAPHPGTRGASFGSLVLTVPSRRSGCACRVEGGCRGQRSALF